jgi:hypothetical protein
VCAAEALAVVTIPLVTEQIIAAVANGAPGLRLYRRTRQQAEEPDHVAGGMIAGLSVDRRGGGARKALPGQSHNCRSAAAAALFPPLPGQPRARRRHCASEAPAPTCACCWPQRWKRVARAVPFRAG